MTLIYAYTRANALADGVLIDITEKARSAGFKLPMAMTSAVAHFIGTAPADPVEKLKIKIERSKRSGRYVKAYRLYKRMKAITEDDGFIINDMKALEDRRTRIILKQAYDSVMRSDKNDYLHFFTVEIPKSHENDVTLTTRLKLHVGPGDDSRPVLTLMFPNED